MFDGFKARRTKCWCLRRKGSPQLRNQRQSFIGRKNVSVVRARLRVFDPGRNAVRVTKGFRTQADNGRVAVFVV